MYRIPRYQISLVRDGSITTEDYPRFTNSTDIFTLMRPLASQADRENFWVLCLDGKNRLIGINSCHVGTLNSATISAREVYKTAILSNAASIICCHNHPSGDPAPSSEDRRVTEKLHAAGTHLDIRLLDHIVIGDTEYFSFADAGIIGG